MKTTTCITCKEDGDISNGWCHFCDCCAECGGKNVMWEGELHAKGCETESSRGEAAEESFLSDFYGGSSPCTSQEQYQAAAAQKRELDR